MQATINRDGCIGCGLCVSICPEIFGMADDGLAEVIAQPTADNLGLALDTADGCPVSVITVET